MLKSYKLHLGYQQAIKYNAVSDLNDDRRSKKKG